MKRPGSYKRRHKAMGEERQQRNDVFAARLRSLRQEAKISQATLGKQLGVSTWTVCCWECGKFFPKYELLRRLGTIFHTTSGYLMNYSDERHPKEPENADASGEQNDSDDFPDLIDLARPKAGPDQTGGPINTEGPTQTDGTINTEGPTQTSELTQTDGPVHTVDPANDYTDEQLLHNAQVINESTRKLGCLSGPTLKLVLAMINTAYRQDKAEGRLVEPLFDITVKPKRWKRRPSRAKGGG